MGVMQQNCLNLYLFSAQTICMSCLDFILKWVWPKWDIIIIFNFFIITKY